MGETSPRGGDASTAVGIPSGLNRIKTRQPSRKPDDGDKLKESRTCGAPKPRTKQRQSKLGSEGHGKNDDSREGLRKGKNIARWLTSHLYKDSTQSSSSILGIEDNNSEFKAVNRQYSTGENFHEAKDSSGKQISPENVCSSKISKGLKSFSHELGPKGGISPAHPRAHSYNDLKELLGSFCWRFEAAKELVNAELSSFAGDIRDILQKNDALCPGQAMVGDLLVLAQQCIEMTSAEFRAQCELIVQDLTEKRQQCQTGLLKWLFTRMLFILTRCTRLLQFQKHSERIDEKSLNIFKKCLESVPAVEMNWMPEPGIVNSGSNCALNQKGDTEPRLQGQTSVPALPLVSWCKAEEPTDESGKTSKKNSSVFEKEPVPQYFQTNSSSPVLQCHHIEGSFPGKSVINDTILGLHHEPERSLDGFDSVICRICEEPVPTIHLESHSYICAYADKCDVNCLDVDERLFKLAEILDQIIESCSLSCHASFGSPESSRMQTSSSTIVSEGYSPKINEWRSKGVEGMFEDLHEMDTACIDDFSLANAINLKGHLGIKLNYYGAASSTGSMSSVSSTNTPKASHFDFFWLEHNNPSELEDAQQMADLADIARCVAGTDVSKEGSLEFLLACMQDLQDILQNSKLKALVIDTFGGRIENLLREKYIFSCELTDTKSPKNDSKHKESTRHLFDSSSQSSTISTPLHPMHKERTSIDDFEIIKPINRGAFGKVFLARKRTTGDLFAIKVLKKLDMIRKNDIERILAERNILITVRNPFVVRFFYSFTCRDNLYLVMEYLNGGDLFSLLRKVGCLEEDVARIYIAELVLALEYLHSLGIVHRDLKPDNVLIAHDGHIKLTDFGLSKIGLINSTVDLSGPEINGSTLFGAHSPHTNRMEDETKQSAVGTPDYLAPEILLGTAHGYAADWWSVGIILFEIITGVPPFTAECPEIIFDNILNRKIPWPHVPNDMSHEAQALVDRFLILDPHQRLGINGSSEVKAHPFFRGMNWDTLALQKAAFVPHPDSIDDTSYFVSRYTQFSSGMPDSNSTDSASDTTDSSSISGLETDECGDLADFNSSPLDLSLINFSFKNLSQLASINYDMLLQTGKDPSKCSSPSKDQVIVHRV
ncbi:probable serine/threonine protein kinase IRE4 isoform X2 [Malania oleifera]|uniref:probable serine/threonine protein kinase IRE4 isoform X2 n=1 Tax=Malania oleifera TaxID=397392 RepID=UPI0025ADB3C7|nr:probable serine/threonine protein kinase IRE4 isoform X2 [Malania oleifera]